MKKIIPLQKSQRQTFWILKACLFFILLFAGAFVVKAQKVPPPVAVFSKDHKPHYFNTSAVKNSSPSVHSAGTGTWTPLTNPAPHYNFGGMLLLSDGTVLCKSGDDSGEDYGTIYDKLTPDSSGSYVNGTWSSIAPMHYDRLYYSSQILKDGRVYVAGGEYGSGNTHGEVYDPLSNTWTLTPDPDTSISDANSEILENGKVLQALVSLHDFYAGTAIYDPATNTYTKGPTAHGIHNESAWVKLPDNSILFVDLPYPGNHHTTERYIPSLNQWVVDDTIPVDIYDLYGFEAGGALLLPDGRAFFIGSTGHTAYYTPSGNASPGTWAVGPDIPNGLGAPDAPAAMMVNGKILCAFAPIPNSRDSVFRSPTYYYEFDYTTNTFTQIDAPGEGTTYDAPSYFHTMLDLPDGSVLYARFGDTQYYIYKPAGAPLQCGKPVIKNINPTSCNTYKLTGTGFNGISEGATYGDDWQMNTNYPIVRLTLGHKVYYCRTSNWNSTGVMRRNAPDSVDVALPAGLPAGTYSLVVTANGIASDPVLITTGIIAQHLNTIDITSTGATLSWTANASPQKWQVQYKIRKWLGSSSWTNVHANGNVRAIRISSLQPNKRYTWRIRAKCEDTWYSYSEKEEFVTKSSSGLITTSYSSKMIQAKDVVTIRAYPNPAKGQFMLELNLTEKVNANAIIQLVDLTGKTVYVDHAPVSNGALQKLINAQGNLTNGVYMVRVLVNNKTYNIKLVYEK